MSVKTYLQIPPLRQSINLHDCPRSLERGQFERTGHFLFVWKVEECDGLSADLTAAVLPETRQDQFRWREEVEDEEEEEEQYEDQDQGGLIIVAELGLTLTVFPSQAPALACLVPPPQWAQFSFNNLQQQSTPQSALSQATRQTRAGYSIPQN